MPDNLHEISPGALDTIDTRRALTGSVQMPGGWTKHAPKGGIAIAGKMFKGGQFIPDEDLEKASPEELKELQEKINNPTATGGGGGEAKEDIWEDQAKKLEQSQTEALRVAVKEKVYVIDNGSLIGATEGRWGFFVIKRSPTVEPELSPEEGNLLLNLQTKRLDIVDPLKNLVLKLSFNENFTTFSYSAATENILPLLLRSSGVEVDTVPLAQYEVLQSLSKPLADFLSPPANTEQEQPPTAEPEAVQGPPASSEMPEMPESPVETTATQTPPPVTRMRLGQNTELIIKQNKDQKIPQEFFVQRLSNPQKAAEEVFVNKIYEAADATVVKLKKILDKEKDASGTETEYAKTATPFLPDKDNIKKLLRSYLLDEFTGNKGAFGPSYNHIIVIKNEPVRTNFADAMHLQDNMLGNIEQKIEKNELSIEDIMEQISKLLNKVDENKLYDLAGEAGYADTNKIKVLSKRLDDLAHWLSLQQGKISSARSLSLLHKNNEPATLGFGPVNPKT